jgi:phosphatidylglycerol:prolipoprotein diacylglycerol transferase
MIDPVIFSFKIAGFTLTLRWYGVIVMIGIVVGALIIERWLKRYGEKSDRIWDALIWVLIPGIIGARLWYVLNAIAGGNRSYLENPASIVRVWEGGLHIFGGFLFGAIALLIYLRQNKLDPWLFLDAAGPAALIGQGIGRIANFINQELYGPPTNLPWGIKIEAEHRLSQYQNLGQFPVEATRFHPTFAYEMLWNFATAGILLWLARRYEKQLKPGTMFAGWLLAAGLGRTWIELFFRPDQPKISGLGLSYSAIFAALMAIAGAVLLMIRYKVISPAFAEDWEEQYQINGEGKAPEEKDEAEEFAEVEDEEPALVEDEVETPRVRKASTKKTSPRTSKAVKKALARRAVKKTGSTVRTTKTKKSSE